MKNCEKCDKKIKNGFKMCYSCNDNKSEVSEPETVKPIYVKDSIPRAVKNCLWINYFGINELVSVPVANESSLR